MADTVISIGGDTRELSAAYKKAERDTGSFAGKVSGTIRDQFAGIGGSIAGAFAAQALVGKLKSTLDYFGDIQDMATRLNTTAESVQQLDLIGAPSGASAESLVNALSRVNRALGDADNAAGRNAFKALGIDMQKLAAASPVDQLMMLSRGFQEAQAKGQGFNEIYDLLGKSAGELIPVLRMSRSELEKLSSTPVLSDDQVSRLDDLGDRLTTLSQKITIEVGGALAGFLEGIEGIGSEVGIAAVEFQQLFSNLSAGDDFDEAQRKAYAFATQLRKVNDEADEARKPIAPIVSPQLAGAQSTKETSQQNDRIGAARTLGEEIALLAAKATGSEKIIESVSREIALNRRVAEIQKEQGVNKSQALAVAKQMQALEDQAERKSNRAKGIPNKIKGGVSSNERGGGLDDFYDRQGKPMDGPATPGLDRFRALQELKPGSEFRDRNRTIAMGKGFTDRRLDPLAAQAAKAADEARRDDGGNGASLETLLKTIADNTRSLADLD
jgi:hypothetical protein